MNRLHLSVLVGLGALASIPATSWGQAVNVDAASLMRRLDAIEMRLKAAEMQRPSVAQRSGPMVSGGSPSSYTLTDLDQRMGDLERQMGQQSGADERVQYAIQQLAKRFDDYTKDTDLRLSDLEAKVSRLGSVQQAPAPIVQPVAPVAITPAAAVAAGSEPVAAAAVPTMVPSNVSTPKAEIPAKISSTDLYNKAYAYLTATDYDNARLWLEEFLKRYPTDKLADNAWYWLGEVQLVQNNPSGAVVSFRNGLKYFPHGAKAPANLYKMGVALEQLKQPELAKGAWEKLMKDYPKSAEAARGKEKMLGLKPTA